MRVTKNFHELSKKQQEAIATQLIAELQRHEARIARDWGQIGRDALDSASGTIWEKIANGRYDPDRPLGPWVRTILRHQLYDHGRYTRSQCSRFKNASSLDGLRDLDACPSMVHNPERIVSDNESLCVRDSSFSRYDLARISSWELQVRTFLMCMSGLWRRVPDELWEAWRLNCVQMIGWPTQDLLAQFHDDQTPQERISIASEELGNKRNTLHQRWRRKKHLLYELEWVKSIFTRS